VQAETGQRICAGSLGTGHVQPLFVAEQIIEAKGLVMRRATERPEVIRHDRLGDAVNPDAQTAFASKACDVSDGASKGFLNELDRVVRSDTTPDTIAANVVTARPVHAF
jgi:hypothetical protein